MVSLNRERMLTFDCEGSVIEKDLPIYKDYHEILRETHFTNGTKYFMIENKEG